jgi:hypothetical protein
MEKLEALAVDLGAKMEKLEALAVGIGAKLPKLQALPAVVISVPEENIVKTDGKESVTFEFDWTKATLGGVELKNLAGEYQTWRLNVFRFSDGKRLPGGGDDCFLPKSKEKTTLSNLPADVLLRADIDFDMSGPTKAGDKKCEVNGGDNKNARFVSFLILLHGPEKPPEGP